MKPSLNPLVVLLLTVGCAPVSAQTIDRASEVQHRNDCRLAGQVLMMGNPHPKRDWAHRIIGSCDATTAVPALVSWWGSQPSDIDELSRLHEASRRFRDDRIYEITRSIAEDESRSPLSRIAALGVLASYVDDHITLSLRFLEPIRGVPGRWTSVWTWDNHSHQEVGEQPLQEDARRAIVALAHHLRDTEQEQLRETARHLSYFPAFARP